MSITFGSNGRSSIHMRWRMIDSLRANATRAVQKPALRPLAAAHTFKASGMDMRDSIALAASNRSLHFRRSRTLISGH